MWNGCWRGPVAPSAFFQTKGCMMSEEIEDVWKMSGLELDSIHKMGTDHQLLVEQTIGNLAALKLLDEQPLEQEVKNS